MAKHENKPHNKRKPKSNNSLIFISLIILVLAVVAIFFIKPIIQNHRYDTYNNFEFAKSQDKNGAIYWSTQIKYKGSLTPITFYNHPKDLENIYYDDTISDYILNKNHSSFIIAVPEDAGSIPVIGGIDIARILGEKFYGFKVSSALYVLENQTTNTTLPTVNCADATNDKPIIYFNVNATEESIKFDENNKNCIILNSLSNERNKVLPVADLFTYNLLGIMNK